MGEFKQEFVCGVLFEERKPSKEKKKLDEFINNNQDLFIKKDPKRNGYVSYVMYVMIWDGSKEGWEESDLANKLREKFIRLLQKNNANVYHVIDDPYSDHPYLFSHYDKYSKEIKVE